jgi:hypothetical protein
MKKPCGKNSRGHTQAALENLKRALDCKPEKGLDMLYMNQGKRFK